VALLAINNGIDPQNVYALKGGLSAWQAAGYPMASGATP
jgi:rhodanese-related sulfurtransferase